MASTEYGANSAARLSSGIASFSLPWSRRNMPYQRWPASRPGLNFRALRYSRSASAQFQS